MRHFDSTLIYTYCMHTRSLLAALILALPCDIIDCHDTLAVHVRGKNIKELIVVCEGH